MITNVCKAFLMVLVPVLAVNAPSAVRNLRLSVYREHSTIIDLRWDPPVQTYGPINFYRIQWRLIGNPRIKEYYMHENVTTTSWRSDMLFDNSLYEFQVRAENSLAIGPESTLRFKTKKYNRIQHELNAKSERIHNANSKTFTVRLTWTPAKGHVKGYRILYKSLMNFYNTRWTVIEIPPTNSIELATFPETSWESFLYALVYAITDDEYIFSDNYVGMNRTVNRSGVQKRQKTQTKTSETNRFMKTLIDLMAIQTQHNSVMNIASLPVF